MKTRNRLMAGIVAAAFLTAALWVFPRREHQDLYQVTILPSLGGPFMYAGAINDRGQIVGVSTDGGLGGRLFLWDRAGGTRDLGPAEAWRPRIDNRGRIAGTMKNASGLLQAFVCEPNGTRTILGTLGTDTKVREVNNRGQVVGEFQTVAGVTHVFLWDETHGMQDLFPASADESYVWAINDRGQILGLSREKGTFLWDLKEGAGEASPQKVRYRDATVMDAQGRFVLKSRAPSGGYCLRIWDPDRDSLTTLDVTMERVEPVRLNAANQVLLKETQPSAFQWWGRNPFRWRVRSYLWDPHQGLIPLDAYVPRQTGEDFVAVDLNNAGCIIGMIIPWMNSRPRAVVLLEPIPERWRK